MGRYILYGSTGSNQLSSVKSTKSEAFDVPSQSSLFPNKTKPLSLKDIDNVNKTTPKNAYIDYIFENEAKFSYFRDKLHKTLNINEVGAQSTFSKYTKYYNRFKLPTVNDAFQKGFAHVFFTRPDCNLLNDKGTGLNSSFEVDPEFLYTWKNTPDLVKQLVLDNGQTHQFMLSLSNKAASFSLSDEYIGTDTYGKTYKGWQVAYGRNNVESKTAGEFQISFNDDRTLHIYQLHRLWVDYISEVYQGRKAPKSEYIRKRILDYAASCYYFITAEDGETIIFWSKYYGIFPTTIPSNQYAWGGSSIIENPKLDITYKFSFKEDMNPEALIEFNANSGVKKSQKYVPIYDPKLGHVGSTWVGAPYIETVTDNTDPECPYTFKLRFRPADSKINYIK